LSGYVRTHGNDHIAVADTLVMLIYNLAIGKDPLYQLEEWCNSLDLSRLQQTGHGRFSDDRFGIALDRLYDADRSSMMTDIVLSFVKEFGVQLSQLHNDSTTIKAFGKIPGKTKSGLELKKGNSKDHRPDLKQLVYTLTVSADCGVPIHHRCYSGNRTDDTTHIETWKILRDLLGNADFLYVGDSKLCTHEQLDYIVSAQGRAVTIIHETWTEVKKFKTELQTKIKAKKIIWRRRKPGKFKKWEYFSVFSGEHLTNAGYRIHWIYSSEKKKRDRDDREHQLQKAETHLAELNARANKGSLKNIDKIKQEINTTLTYYGVSNFLKTDIIETRTTNRVQAGRGRPSATTQYKKIQQSTFGIAWHRDKTALQQESRLDGVFPLLSTDVTMSTKAVLQTYKYQPRLEKRFAQFKSIHNAAPLLFKKIERVEANMFAFFIALVLQALLEREIRMAMKDEDIEKLYIYPEDRECSAPTTSIVFDRFAQLSRYEIIENGVIVEQFRDDLSQPQKDILDVLGISEDQYWNP
jgi:transposase